MKTWKKVLIGVAIVIVIGALGYGVMKISDTISEKIEPDMARYITMTETEQNQYVIEHMDEFLVMLINHGENAEDKATLEAVKNDPEIRESGIAWGRSLCAVVIINTDSLKGKLNPEQAEKFKKEADEENIRGDKFTKALDKYTKK